MTREAQIKTLLLADAPMVALLPGGIYTNEQLGIEGFRREEGSPTENAFDADGYLLPCALIKEGSIFPFSDVRSMKEKLVATSQMVDIYYYENRGHSDIDLAKLRAYELLEGERLPTSYPIWWSFETSPLPDVGPVMNSTTVRQTWQIISIRR